MKSTALTKTTPTALTTVERLLAEAQKGTPARHALKPQKVADSGDLVLGTLSEPLQRMWLLEQSLLATVTEIVARFTALKAEHVREHELQGDSIHQTDACKKFHAAVGELDKELDAPYKQLVTIGTTFRLLAGLDFELSSDMPIIGVRKGFQLVCRQDNLRKDKFDPVEEMNRSSRSALRIIVVSDAGGFPFYDDQPEGFPFSGFESIFNGFPGQFRPLSGTHRGPR